MRLTTMTAIAAALTLSVASIAGAQPPPPDAPDRPQRDQQQDRRAEVQRRIETIRIARLTEELNLDPETAVHLIPLLKQNDELRRSHHQRLRELAQDSRAALAGDEPDEGRLEELVEEFWDQEEAFLQARRDVFDEMADILTPEQQVRLIEFGPRFEREIRGLMRDAQEIRKLRRERGRGPAEQPGEGDWWREDPAPRAPGESDLP